MRLGDDAAAWIRIRRAASLNSGRADVWALMGLLELRKKNVEGALEHLQRALKLDPGNRDARDTLRQIEKRVKKRRSSGGQDPPR